MKPCFHTKSVRFGRTELFFFSPESSPRDLQFGHGFRTCSLENTRKKLDFHTFGGHFWRLLGAFWRLKAVPNSIVILGCSFVGFRDGARLRGVVDGSPARLQRRSRRSGSPLVGAPFARGESYKRLGSQALRPKASLPKASQASQTRSNTQWARGPANFQQAPKLFSMLAFAAGVL